jgi:hypothetical protein
MSEDLQARSVDACPRCGVHRLALAEPPKIVDLGYQPLNEVYGFQGEVTDPVEPAIECLSCGALWPDLAAFRADTSTDVDDHLPA